MVAEMYDSGELHQALNVPFEPIQDVQNEKHSKRRSKSPPALLARLGNENQRSPQNDRRSPRNDTQRPSQKASRRSSKRKHDMSPPREEYVVMDSDDSAWEAADQGARRAAAGSESESEGGRYGVKPARKRQGKGPKREEVWVSDESEEEGHVKPKGGLSISGASERARRNGGKDGGANGEAQRERVDKRREYWRSKGSSGGNEETD